MTNYIKKSFASRHEHPSDTREPLFGEGPASGSEQPAANSV